MAKLINIGMFAGWLALLLVTYWLLWPIEPIRKIDDNPRVLIDAAVPGGVVARELKFTVRKDVTVHTSRRLIRIDCEEKCPTYELEASMQLWRAGQHIQNRALQVPAYVQPGRYRIDIFDRWSENPLRDGVQIIPSWEIMVLP